MPVDPYKCHFNSFILNSCLCKDIGSRQKAFIHQVFVSYQVNKIRNHECQSCIFKRTDSNLPLILLTKILYKVFFFFEEPWNVVRNLNYFFLTDMVTRIALSDYMQINLMILQMRLICMYY